ncbi:MAG: helix-turn-helix domain-containing protein, partial [Gammaproteobacteria bacterium]|nr:helix-turn-helix domain-containing protein [Gammaproteobacteria bacterium]
MLIMEGRSKSDIALLLGKHRSTIYKEISRNRISGRYSPTKATEYYLKRHANKSKIKSDFKLQQAVSYFLK